ncbi:MAG: metallophosphoesterase [Verrucomicrobium sp.]
MKLVHLSDLHFGTVPPDRPKALHAAVVAANPDLVVISGDVSQRGTLREMTEAKEFLATLPHPQLLVPGNHDMPRPLNVLERFRKPFRIFKQVFGEDLEPVWRNEAHTMVVSGLNSARPGGWYMDWSRGRVSAGQLIRLRKTFADATPDALRVLVVHHPPAAPPQGTRRHLIDKRPALFGALNEAGVDLVLSGHFHLSYAVPVKLPGVHPRHCVLSVTSTATSHRLKGEPNGFHIINGDRGHLNIEALAWDGGSYALAHAWEFHRGDDGDWSDRSPASKNYKAIRLERDRSAK